MIFCLWAFSRFVLPVLNMFKIDISNLLLRMTRFAVFISICFFFSCNRDWRCLFYLRSIWWLPLSVLLDDKNRSEWRCLEMLVSWTGRKTFYLWFLLLWVLGNSTHFLVTAPVRSLGSVLCHWIILPLYVENRFVIDSVHLIQAVPTCL